MKLIVGLGNPGSTYRYNRHNIGFLLVNRLSKSWRIRIKLDSATKSRQGKGKVQDKEVILAYPLSFMNLTGKSVKLLLDRYGLDPHQELLVVFDDLDLEYGQIRIRPRGKSGGHKGVESIIRALGSSDFTRLRIGIGRPRLEKRLSEVRRKKHIVDYVLNNWTRKERSQLAGHLERAADCAKTWIIWGIQKAMNQFNPAPLKHSKK